MRALVSFVAVAVAVVGQLTIVDRIAFPGGAGPDLVLVLVAALALASGPLVGSLTGFWGGLALDVAPPGSHFTGQNALVFCLVGYSCGLLADAPSGDGAAEPGHTALFEIVVTAVGAICGEALVALLGVMLSDPRVTWPAITHVLPAAAAYDAVACPFVLYAAAAALRLAGTRTPLGARGEGNTQRAAPRREPQLKLGHGWLAGGGLGTAFAATSALSGPTKVRFSGRRREGVLGGSRLGGSRLGGSRLDGSRPGGSPRGGSLRGGSLRGASLARTRMGRSLLGGSVFSRSSPALARTAFSGRAAPLGRSPAPRFSRGKALSRLTGSMHRSARPRSPGRGWLRGTSPRSSALGRADLRAAGAGIGRRAFGRGTFRSRSFRSGAIGGSSLSRGSLTGGSWRRGTPRLGSGRAARLRLPRRKRGGYR